MPSNPCRRVHYHPLSVSSWTREQKVEILSVFCNSACTITVISTCHSREGDMGMSRKDLRVSNNRTNLALLHRSIVLYLIFEASHLAGDKRIGPIGR